MGQRVVFQYAAGHDVYRFASEAAFYQCDFSGAVLVGASSQTPTSVAIPIPSTAWFACKSGTHCKSGQKVKVTVQPATAPTPSPTAASTVAVVRVTGQVQLTGMSAAEFQQDASLALAMRSTLAALSSSGTEVVSSSQVELQVLSLPGRRLLAVGVRLAYTIACQRMNPERVASRLTTKMANGGTALARTFRAQVLAQGGQGAVLVQDRTLSMTGTAGVEKKQERGGEADGVSIALIAGVGGAVVLLLGVAGSLWWSGYCRDSCPVEPADIPGTMGKHSKGGNLKYKGGGSLPPLPTMQVGVQMQAPRKAGKGERGLPPLRGGKK